MKRLLHFTIGSLLLLFAACDEVALEERFVQMEAITPRRAVLLEDFTGQWCSNCPDAHKIINELKEQYGEALFIAVAVHAGSDKNAILEGSIPGLVGLKQPEGDDYAARWGIEAYPSGVVNRRGGKSTYQDWPNLVREALLQESSLEMELTAAENEAGEIAVDVRLLPAADISGELQVWIVESGITALQQVGTALDVAYIHNHVYRASVNGIWGEKVSLASNVYKQFTYTLPVKENWVKENLSVVAFVYNDNGVEQVAESPLVCVKKEE